MKKLMAAWRCSHFEPVKSFDGRLVQATVERILPGGLGLAHADDRTMMIGLAAPGDLVRVRVDRVKGSVVFASIEEIISPSEARVEPPCPYFGRCGGCDFQQLSYEAQLQAKKEIIRDCLRRIGGLENIPDFQIRPAPNQWHYRARAQWQYDSIRKRLGYFESGSRRVCDVAECAVLTPQLQQTLEKLRAEMNDGLLPDDARHFRAVLGDDNVSITSDSVKRPTNRAQTASPRGAVHPKTNFDSNARDVTRMIDGERYRFNAQSFFQTNTDLLSEMIDAALGHASGRTAVELYCGVGLFTLPLARKFLRVTAVEDDAAAATLARENLSDADLPNADIVNRDVADWLEANFESIGGDAALDRLPQGERSHRPAQDAGTQSRIVGGVLEELDFLLLDPPRTGAESRVINGIVKLKPQRICYVSCDPATLARDLKKLLAGGYDLKSLAALDMFPQTHHVETVVHLIRS